ncbi:hypothetical protein GCM10023215_30430 [Pseudonocardia yuanmonensis]|uniref:HTH luxR-type domain-containing protein n=1 Tax=Pseudonocardia yuanmonensis TaxID=1095914 RepID=A0ABP8WNJ7_9PSEU
MGGAHHRLLDRLRRSDKGLVVVSGPAGAGKTRLVETWLLDEPDARVVYLTRHHDAAGPLLRTLLDALGVPAVRSDPDDVPTWIGAIRTVVARSTRFLVIDGAEAVTDPQAELLLQDLLDHRPEGLRLVVTTRHRSPSWLVRGRACDTAESIGAADLRLTADEVHALAGRALPELDGWALGVRLTASAGAAGVETIRDFLRTEVTDRVTTEVRHLLHAVAVPGAACAELAAYLSGIPAAGRLLSRFAGTTQFATVTTTASGAPLFALHPVLLRRLREELTTEHWASWVALRTRHAEWLADRGALDRAVLEFVRLGRVDLARDTLLARWQGLVLGGDPDVVLRALGHLPLGETARDPRLCVLTAMTHLAVGDHRIWQRWMEVAARHPGAAEHCDVEPGLSLSAALAAARRFAESITTGTVPARPDGAVPPGLWGAISEVADGLAKVWSGEWGSARRRLHGAEVAARVSGDQLALAHTLAGLALSAAMDSDGNPTTTFRYAAEAIGLADRLAPSCRWVVANAHLALATVHRSAGANEAARAAVREVLRALDSVDTLVEYRTRTRARELIAEWDRTSPCNFRELTARERRVLRALCGPLTLREIADELYVSHNTVKSQVRSIFRKLGVHDRAAAVTAARSGVSEQRS